MALECISRMPWQHKQNFDLLRQISFKTRDASQNGTEEEFRQYRSMPIVSPLCRPFF
jgi:hypothetical protein